MISDCVESNKIKIVVNPNSKETKILEEDLENKVIKIALKEPAEGNRANKELVKFIKKQLKREVKIKKGLNSREKLLEIL